MREEIFISYSHKDSKYLDEFCGILTPYRQKYGITSWNDQDILPGNVWLEEIENAIQRAKVAVLLVSANFLASRFITESELPTILERAQKGGVRILWVLISACLWNETEIAKYQSVFDCTKPLDQMKGPQKWAAWTKIARRIFDGFQSAVPAAPPGSLGKQRSVLLAQVTDDLEEEAAQLRSYLQQYSDELLVLPREAYPQGGDVFKAAFDHDLSESSFFVQLLGPHMGRVPPDLPEGYTRWQLERAQAEAPRVQIMQWRHPGLDTALVQNASYQKILTAETVVASGLESFKNLVRKLATEMPSKSHNQKTATVFINADEKDMPIAKEVERECIAQALTTILPMIGPSSEEIRKDLEENLIDCDVLVFIYGNTTQKWIRSQLKFFGKVKPRRESPPRLLAICSGPPPKPDIGISFPNAHLITCPDSWDFAPIRSLIAEFGA